MTWRCLAAVAASAAAACLAQEPFRVDVKLINVAVAVRDAGGKPVTDLTAGDFEILEDGVPQKLAFFARSQDVPLNLGLLVDYSGSQNPYIKAHTRDLGTFLKSVLGPADSAFLLCFGNRLRIPIEGASSAPPILDGLKQFERRANSFPELGPIEDRAGGTAFYDALYHSTNELLSGAGPGRKALVIFSDGEDNSSAHHMMEALEAAQNNNVVLFGVRYTNIHDGRLNARNKYGAAVIERLARDSGGAAFDVREGNLVAHFKAIGEQLRLSYELAYHSTNPADDGAFRKITVRLKRPGLAVRAKSGYYAEPPAKAK